MSLQPHRVFLGCLCIFFVLAGCRSNPAQRSARDDRRYSYAMPDDFELHVQTKDSVSFSEAPVKKRRRDGRIRQRISLPLVKSNRRSREKTSVNSELDRELKDDSLVQMTPSTINRWKVFGKMEQNFRSLFFISEDRKEESLTRSETEESNWGRPIADRPAQLPLAKTNETPLLVPPPAPAVEKTGEFKVLSNTEVESPKSKSSFKDRLIELWPYSLLK